MCGFGFGTTSTCFHVINALSALAGPAGYSIDDTRYFLPVATILHGMMLTFHHTSWSIIMFDSLNTYHSNDIRDGRLPWPVQLASVFLLHLAVVLLVSQSVLLLWSFLHFIYFRC